MRVVAVDWSGDATVRGQRQHIWEATAADGRLVSLTNGLRRCELIERIKGWADDDPELAVGLDFAFSLPHWFLSERGLKSPYELWNLVGREGEGWLADCRPPFWGRVGTRKVPAQELFRRTELDCQPVAGIAPKSVFQISGPGAVGTGSIRGMPFLRELHDSGFSIWPFDAPGWPRVVEIYPRALTGAVVKSDQSSRQKHRAMGKLPADLRMVAESSEDAFDSAVSALAMSEDVEALRRLERTTDPIVSLEGEIWHSSNADGFLQAFGAR